MLAVVRPPPPPRSTVRSSAATRRRPLRSSRPTISPDQPPLDAVGLHDDQGSVHESGTLAKAPTRARVSPGGQRPRQEPGGRRPPRRGTRPPAAVRPAGPSGGPAATASATESAVSCSSPERARPPRPPARRAGPGASRARRPPPWSPRPGRSGASMAEGSRPRACPTTATDGPSTANSSTRARGQRLHARHVVGPVHQDQGLAARPPPAARHLHRRQALLAPRPRPAAPRRRPRPRPGRRPR